MKTICIFQIDEWQFVPRNTYKISFPIEKNTHPKNRATKWALAFHIEFNIYFLVIPQQISNT